MAVTGRKPQGWCGPEAERREANYTARRFPPEATAEGLALTAWGTKSPIKGKKVSQRLSVKMREGWKPDGGRRRKAAPFTTARSRSGAPKWSYDLLRSESRISIANLSTTSGPLRGLGGIWSGKIVEGRIPL